MSSVIMFSECGQGQRIEFAKDALMGRKNICVLIDRDCFGISTKTAEDPPFRLNPGGAYDHSARISFFKQFETKRYLDHAQDETGEWIFTASNHPGGEWDQPLLDHLRLQRWISKNNRRVGSVVYPLLYSKEISAEIVAGKIEGIFLPEIQDGVVQCWIPDSGVLVTVNEDIREILEPLPGYPFEFNGVIYTQVSRFTPVALAFVDQIKDAELKPKKRTRSTIPNIMVGDYLADCMEKNTNPSLDDCWRYLEGRPEVVEFKLGLIFYNTQSGKEKTLSRDQLSGVLGRAIKRQ